MSCKGILPKLDAAVFADTQWEPKAVYDHLEWITAEAAAHGIPVIRATRGNLRQDGLDFRRHGGKAQGGTKRHASIPVFVKNPNGGKEGIVNRQCTKDYKIEVVERAIRYEVLKLRPRQKAPERSVELWLGISADETYRRRTSPNHWQVFRFPLLDDVDSPRKDSLFPHGFDRQDCLDWFGQHYPGRNLPRSACIGCPFHTDEEWVRMRDQDPEAWADAVDFDAEMRAAGAAHIAETGKNANGRLLGLPYLHRSCVPLPLVQFKVNDAQAAFEYGMGNECLGMCGV